MEKQSSGQWAAAKRLTLIHRFNYFILAPKPFKSHHPSSFSLPLAIECSLPPPHTPPSTIMHYHSPNPAQHCHRVYAPIRYTAMSLTHLSLYLLGRSS